LQDSSEAAVIQLPQAGQPRRVIDQVMQLARWRPVDDWCFDEVWGPDFDFYARFDPNNSSHNYGGNFEVVPPYAGKPWGRVMFGGGTGPLLGTTTNVTDQMVQSYKDFFDAAQIQGPHLQITSEWLAVGHVDEFTMFVPAPGTARGWVCLIASPQRAVSILQGMQAANGAATVFAGRAGWQTTVNGILNNAAAMTLQQQAQARIDQARAQIKTATGLTDIDFVELPTLFEYVGGNYVAAWNPGVVNLVCMPVPSGTIYLAIPDPEGPDIAGVDQFQLDINNQLAPLDTGAKPYSITYVDVFFSYHDLLGDIHCGSNFVRTPPNDDWWNK
jgi:protein-arginine deiminase